jgi:hypothetical protein
MCATLDVDLDGDGALWMLREKNANAVDHQLDLLRLVSFELAVGGVVSEA